MAAVSKSAVPDVLAPSSTPFFAASTRAVPPGREGGAFRESAERLLAPLHAASFTPRLSTRRSSTTRSRYGIGMTNAAYRTTPGSRTSARVHFTGRAGGSRGSPRAPAARDQLRRQGGLPRPVRRAAGLGLQARRLGDTLLFVLPSTSPANAAVPWAERLRWFRALRELIPLDSQRGARLPGK